MEIKTNIKIGKIPQNSIDQNEAIEWTIVSNKIDRVVLISNKILLIYPFDIDNSIYWFDSSIRKYLNNHLVNIIFTPVERNRLIKTSILNVDEFDNSIQRTDDLIWIPSLKDIKRIKKKAGITSVAYKNAFPESTNFTPQYFRYWLRTPGVYVNGNGITYSGYSSKSNVVGVRLMISIKKGE